jgi:RNA polymerase sigma factor, sigma-70 family
MFILFLITDEERSSINFYLKEIAGGSADSLTALYRLAGGRMLSVAVGITRNAGDAEDVVQDSLIKIVRFAHRFKAGTNGYAWICKIVQNTALNKVKSENLRRADNIDSVFNLSDGRDFLGGGIASNDVKRAMLSLTPKERLVIWLKYFNDMTVRDIASEAGLKKTTAQDLIKKAEEKLRKLLE